MNFVNPPYLLSKLTQRNIVWRIQNDKPVIYLTFDDGPIPEITPFVLNTLNEYNAKATFFCVGDNVRKHNDIFKEIINSGHKAGNHTFNHLNGWKTHSSNYLENINNCENYFISDLFRPPYGKLKASQLIKIRKKYVVVMWSVLSCDYDQGITKEECLNNSISFADKGSVVVFHDNLKAKDNLLYALPRFLDHYSKKGFSFEILTKDLCEETLSQPFKICLK